MGLDHPGGDAYLRDAESELFLLAATNMSASDTFYEGDRQSALFRWLLDRRHHDDAVADRSQLPVLAASATLDAALGRRLDHTVANYPALDGTPCRDRHVVVDDGHRPHMA